MNERQVKASFHVFHLPLNVRKSALSANFLTINEGDGDADAELVPGSLIDYCVVDDRLSFFSERSSSPIYRHSTCPSALCLR